MTHARSAPLSSDVGGLVRERAAVGRPATADPGTAAVRPAFGRRTGAIVLLVLLLGGLGLRLVDLDRSPLSFHPARQYRSLIIAKDLHLAATRPADDPQRVNAHLGAVGAGDLEPTFLEAGVATIWRVTGVELWVPRLVMTAIWSAGAVAAWSILRRLGGRIAQVVGTAAFLVLPMAVAASRSFQPDALMVALGLAAMAAALAAEQDRRPRLWLGAVALGAAAVLVKPMIGPVVLGWFLAVLVAERGLRALVAWRLVALGAGLVAPTAAYYLRGKLRGDASGSWMDGSLVPSLLTDAAMYGTWYQTIDRAVPVGFVLLAVVGVAATRGPARILLASALAGHVAMGVLVNYRSATHDYYHLPLVALTAIGLGITVEDAARRLGDSALAPEVRRAGLALGGAVLVLVAFAFATGFRGLEAPIGRASHHVATSQRIGELTDHSRHVLSLTPSYGTDLAFDGGVVATEYPDADTAALLQARGLPIPDPAEVIADSGADWFAVTNEAALRNLPALEAELAADHEMVASGEGWQLWRLTQP